MVFIKNLIELTRGYTISITIASCLVILSYAHYSMYFNIFNFILLTITLCLLQMGANLFDDYIDVKKQLKQGLPLEKITFSTQRKAVLILNKTFSIKQVEIILLSIFSFAILTGLYFAFYSGWQVLIFAFLGGILTLFYPISSKYYLAEVVVGLIFGPLMIMGGYFALTQEFNSNLFLLSWAIFLTTIVLLHTHNIMDWEFDIKEGKNTFAILTKSKINAICAQKWMIIIAYSIVVFGVLNLNFNPKMLYVFLTLPIATKLQESIKDYINIKDIDFIPRWYYGPFENWENIKKNKLDFFMYRFYLARNFALFFALFASIGAIL